MSDQLIKSNKDKVFNYKAVNEKFNFLIKHASEIYPKTKEDIDDIIFLLKTKNEADTTDMIRNFFSYAEIDDEPVLVTTNDKNRRKVLPLNEIFDVIVEAHLFLNHGSIKKTSSMITEHYYIPNHWIQTGIEMCNVCYPIKETKTPVVINKKNIKRGHVVYTTILEKVNDFGVKHCLLLYIDLSSDYCILKYIELYMKHEIGMALFKIFSDFGVPKQIICDSISINTIRDSLKALDKLSLPYRLPIVKSYSGNKPDNVYIKSISDAIDNFLSSKSNSTYPVLLSSLQFKLNTSNIVTSNVIRNCNYYHLFHVDENIKVYKFIEPEEPSQKHTEHLSQTNCHKCSKRVYKVHTCHYCNLIFHVTCCEQVMKENFTIRVICANCKEIN